MASYPNGQPYRSLYANHIGPSPQSNQYTAARFDMGNDTTSYYEDQEEHRAGTRSHRVTSNAGIQEGELFIGTDLGQLNAFNNGGYQHRNSPPLPPLPTSHPSYNPQEYGPPQAQQSPQVYSNPSPIQTTGYQPYVPAAYQATNAMQQPNYNNQTFSPIYGSPTLHYLPGQSPSIPPRPTEQSASHRRLSQLGASSNHQFPYSVSVSPQRQPAYTPPAPPPPPFSPNRDAFPSNIPPPLPQRTHQYSNATPRSPTFTPGSRQSSLNRLPPLPNSLGDMSYTSSYANRPSPATSSPSLPGPTPPPHSPQRTNTIGRHPQARPLPGPPPETPDSNLDTDYFGNGGAYDYNRSVPGVDDIMREVEDAVMGRPATLGIHGQSPRSERIHHQTRIDEEEEPMPLFSGHSSNVISPDTRHVRSNGTGATSSGNNATYDLYSDESDAEAAAGLAAMQLADEQDAAEESRRNSSNTATSRTQEAQQSLSQDHHGQDQSSDSDLHMDIETYGGGLSNHYEYSYGNYPVQPSSHPSSQTNLSDSGDANPYDGSTEALQRSTISEVALPMPPGNYYMSDDEAIHPFPTFGARVDTGGTGGLQEPSSHPRRLSFEDGDEATLVDYSEFARTPSSASTMTYRDSISAYPARTASRPLPRVPLSGSEYSQRRRQTDQFGRPLYPLAPDEYTQYSTAGTAVQKANSIGSHSTTPHVLPPGRSVTDAEQRRRHQLLSGLRTDAVTDADASMMYSGKLGGLDLPAIPPGRRKKFVPEKLSTHDYKRCPEPWALSGVLAWIKEMTDGEADLREQAIVDGIVQLFTHKVPTMNTADAEALSAKVVSNMFSVGALVKEEEWVKFGAESMSGILYQITGAGCYSCRAHDVTISGRCYSHHCMRTLKKIDLQTYDLDSQHTEEDWATFYKLKPGDYIKDSTLWKRQNQIHEICHTEENYVNQMKFWKVFYGDALAGTPRDYIIPRNRMKRFIEIVFGKVDAVRQVNEEYMLPQLKYRQEKEGPWISGVSDIFREWVRKAKQPYIDFAANHPRAKSMFTKEMNTNPLFQQFIAKVDAAGAKPNHRLNWETFIIHPTTRIQRYILLLTTLIGDTDDPEEKQKTQLAIDEIKAVAVECDIRVGEMIKVLEMEKLDEKLVLRPEMDNVKLNLKHLGRQLIFQGTLHRKARVSWVDTHAILFDHYLVLSKVDQQRDSVGNKRDIYDVSKLPIPMDLLVLESTNDDPVIKSSVRGVTAVPSVPSRTQLPQEARFARTTSNQSTGTGSATLTHTNTNSSVGSNGPGSSNRAIAPPAVLDPPNEKILYPFRIKHLGKSDMYTLYAQTAQNRLDWCEKIVDAKTRHAASLFAQNAEPFKLRIMADTAFQYDATSGGPKSVVICGTPLDRAVRAIEREYGGSRPNPVCRAQVNCATAFSHPYGKKMVAVGTDYGVYISEYENPRGWTKAVQANKVTQVGVLEEFSLFLIISDRSLVAYHLDTVCPAGGAANATLESSNRRAPQKLSGSRDVGFFATGRMKDRTLVFYKKKDNTHSTFKVIEPVYQKSSVSTRNRFGIKKGTTDIFRDFDEFYIPVETYAMNLFSSSLAVATARGVEVLTLDKKVPFSIPDLKAPECTHIAGRIRDQKPLGMFRLSESEFLLVFEEVGIYVDKHGDVSRAVVMEFVGKAKQAVLHGGKYLVLVDMGSGFVEVRNAIDGRLKQVISGRDVRLLDDGTGGGTVKICMQHPELERCQVVLEMIINEGLKE